jgi:Zn-dependent M28 family amino/carboxypeptidase
MSPIPYFCPFSPPFKRMLMTISFFRGALAGALFMSTLACNNADTGKSTAADTTHANADLSTLNKDSLAAHIRILASDSFQGRRPFTAGEAHTVDYLVSTFKRLGLEPGNGAEYTQDVPMVEITPVGTPVMHMSWGTAAGLDPQWMNDFVVWTERPGETATLDHDDLVFAGFGIVAPEYHWNDYAGLNVKGKVVLVMVNDPGFYDSSLFKGHTMTYYGRWTYKYEEAARQGAKACLIIHNTAAASYPFQVVQSSNGGVKLHLDTRSNPSYQLAMQGWVTEPTAMKILAAAGKDSTLLEKAHHAGFRPVPLPVKVSANLQVKEVYNQSHNVIAKITGSKKPNEFVIYSAHWDHLGIGKPDARGDSIYNGAADNASGTAALLELARAFKNLPTPPDRTIVFLAVTAEEQGLLGSAWYAQHPVYPLATTVANLNIDVLNTYGPTKDITYSGKGQSELEDYLAQEAARKGRYVATEDHPEAGHYFRSDHFNFARAGVPSITADGGVDGVTGGVEFGKKKHDEYTNNRYHQPSDEINDSWDLNGGLQDVGLVFLIGKRLAYGTEWPQWKAGSEFKAIRDKTAAARK